MARIRWDQDWSKVSVEDLAEAVSVLANSIGGAEQTVLEEAAVQLWRLADLEQ